jgi:hypothetical protein
MSNHSQNQTQRFNLDPSFWSDLDHLENGEYGCEYSYEVACHLKQLEKKGFINHHSQRKTVENHENP